MMRVLTLPPAERLVMLNNVMRWNITTGKLRRQVLRSAEGHADCDRMLDNARHVLQEIMRLEKELGL